MKRDKQSEQILIVDDERTTRKPERAFLDRKDPNSGAVPIPGLSTFALLASGLIGGTARWKSRHHTAGICPKEIQ